MWNVVTNPKIETRLSLWSWAALRKLGSQPDSDEAVKIIGVVIQVPMHGGHDVLAVYSDDSARYVNHSGKIIVWNLPDTRMSKLVHTIMERSNNLDYSEPTLMHDQIGADVVRITALTIGGNRVSEVAIDSLRTSPINEVLSVGAELIGNLAKRSEEATKESR